MAEVKSSSGSSLSLSFPWFITFIVLKNVSVYGATWSWWWLLMPVVPVVGTFVHRFLL